MRRRFTPTWSERYLFRGLLRQTLYSSSLPPGLPLIPCLRILCTHRTGVPTNPKLFPQLILQKPLVRKMQRLLLVGEHQKRRRRGLRLRNVIDPNAAVPWAACRAANRSTSATDSSLASRSSSSRSARHLIDQRKQLLGASRVFADINTIGA